MYEYHIFLLFIYSLCIWSCLFHCIRGCYEREPTVIIDVATESDTGSDTDDEERLQVQLNTLPPITTLKVDKPLLSPPSPPEYTSLMRSNEVAYTEIVKIQPIDVKIP
jgi:hypothetical protein